MNSNHWRWSNENVMCRVVWLCLNEPRKILFGIWLVQKMKILLNLVEVLVKFFGFSILVILV